MADEVPAFDDIPSFDDMQSEAAPPQAQAAAVPRFDDIPDFDSMKSEAGPQPEGPFMSGVREAAHSVIPSLASAVGFGAGAVVGGAAGALTSPVTGPVGPIVGAGGVGVAGAVAASMGAAAIQEKALNALGFDDAEQRAVNAAANPNSSFTGQIIPALATMSPAGIGGGVAKQVGVRAVGAGLGGGFEAGQEYLMEGHVDPTKVAIAGAAGAALPNFNRVGQKFVDVGERAARGVGARIPGRPGAPVGPEVPDTPDVEVDVGASPLAQAAEPPAAATVEPARSERNYGKGTQGPQEGTALTEGALAPDVQAAVEAAAPPEAKKQRRAQKLGLKPRPATDSLDASLNDNTTIPGFDDHPSGVGQAPRAPTPVASEDGLVDASRIQREALDKIKAKQAAQNQGDQYVEPEAFTLDPDRAAAPVPPAVDTGFPKPGEPVATGANDATPLPAGTPKKAAKAIARSKGLVPAIRDSDGNLHVGKPGTVHADLLNTEKPFHWNGDADMGFVTNDGKFLTRVEALKYVDQNKIARNKDARVGKYWVAENKLTADELKPVTAAVTAPDFKGEAPINASITDAQKAAGNYPKARAMDFGKPLALETHAGDKRVGTSPKGEKWEVDLPYDYGYFNKTKGKDKDHIDWARPPKDAPEHGDKHFVIDQRNIEKGGFDEHKVFTYVKDEAAARDLYARGFSDGKGPDRLGAITEVSRGDLVKWLARHTKKAANQPYDKAGFEIEQGSRDLRTAMGRDPNTGATAKEPKVVTRAVELMQKQGLPEDAIERFRALPASERAVEATKYVNAVGSKTGNVKSAEVVRIRPKPAEVPGAEGITARSKADAKRKGDALAALKKAADDTPPAEAETHDQLRARLERLVELGGKAQSDYRPNVKPASWLMVKQAKQMLALKKWTPAKVEAWTANEKLLRSGNKDAVADVRGTNRIEADVARSRRSGDDAIASAEAQQSKPAVNTAEDEMIAAIDAKRGGKFDVPHEEAEAMVEPKPIRTKADLPKKASKKTVDVADSVLAQIDTKKITAAVNSEAAAKRKAEAAALQKKAAAAPKAESEGAASKPKNIQVVDPKELERLNALMNKAADRGKRLETEVKSGARDLVEGKLPPPSKDAGLLDRFFGDESGSVDVGKIKADLLKALGTTHHKSYIAKTSKVAHSDYVRSLDESLHKVDLADEGHKGGLRKQWQALPKELNNPKTLEKMYLLHEQGKLNVLTPEERALYDTHLKPVLDENTAFVNAIRAIDENIIGPDVLNHIARIAKNDAGALMLDAPDDPTAPRTHTLVTKADSSRLRKFVALERVSDGKRFVIGLRNNGFTLWDKYKATRIKDTAFDFEAGKAYKAGPVDYIMRDAYTPEIEANARGDDNKPMQYYKNAALSAYVANAQLGSMARQLAELHRIANTPEFKKLTARAGSEKAAAHPDWIESRLKGKLFDGLVMDPHLRYVFDDYAKAGFDTPEALRKLSQGVTKLLFWTPVAHMANVGVHWQVGRGWDWITPKGTRSLFVDGFDAIKSVITQDDFQAQLRKEGAGLILPSVMNRRFMEQVFKGVGEDIKRRPSEWRPILKKLGLGDDAQDVLGSPLRWLDKHVYDNSAKIMWAANDVFITQRVKELMRKGMSMRDAIVDAERDIPNYRVPTTLITEGKWGRIMQQMATSPEILSFGRYHYGVFNSMAHIIKNLLGKDATLGDRADATGKLFAMGLMAFVAYPIMDAAIKVLTGNPEATSHRRGPLAVTSHIGGSLSGKTDIMQAMRSTTTIPPLTSTVLETLANRDYRGKQIVEPGDVARGAKGDLKAAGRAALQFGEHKLKGLVSPYSTLANADKKKLGPLEAVRDSLLDAKNPSAKGIQYERMIGIHNDRDARARFKQGGHGPLEKVFGKQTGYR